MAGTRRLVGRLGAGMRRVASSDPQEQRKRERQRQLRPQLRSRRSASPDGIGTSDAPIPCGGICLQTGSCLLIAGVCAVAACSPGSSVSPSASGLPLLFTPCFVACHCSGVCLWWHWLRRYRWRWPLRWRLWCTGSCGRNFMADHALVASAKSGEASTSRIMISKHFYVKAAYALLLSRRLRRRGEGFSLLEMVVVLAIIGILVAIQLPNVIGNTDKAKFVAAQTQISNAVTECATAKTNGASEIELTFRSAKFLDQVPSMGTDPNGYKWDNAASRGVPLCAYCPWTAKVIMRSIKGGQF